MKILNVLSIILTLSIFSYAAIGFSAESKTKSPHDHSTMNSAMSDPKFLDQMIAHNEDSIKMGQLVKKKSTNKEVRTLAENMISKETKEIKEMEDWKKNKFSESLALKGMMTKMDMNRLDNSLGNDFDVTYTLMMIEHHKQGIKMAEDSLPLLKDQEIKHFANEMAKSLKLEITKLDHLHSSSQNGADEGATSIKN